MYKKISIISMLLFAALMLQAQDHSGGASVPGGAYYLFPDYAYYTNPALLAFYDSKMLYFETEFNHSGSTNTTSRIDDSTGAKGGSEKISNNLFLPSVQLEGFFPGKKGAMYGFYLYYGHEADLNKTTLDRFNSLSENSVVTALDQSAQFGGEFYSSFDLGERFNLSKVKKDTLHFGVSAGYYFGVNPKTFRSTVDSSISTAGTVWDEIEANDEYLHDLLFNAGISYEKSDFDLFFAVDYAFGYTDRNNKYVAVDTSDDLKNDSVIEYPEFMTDANQSHLGLANVESFEYLDRSIYNKISIHPVINYRFSNQWNIMLSVDYPLYEHSARTEYDRINREGDPDTADQSLLKTELDAGLYSIDALMILGYFNEKKNLEVRFGGGYLRNHQRKALSGTNEQGIRLFSRQNTNQYDEVNLGLDPANNSITGLELSPSELIEQSALLQAGLIWDVTKEISLYLTATAQCEFQKYVYSVYNLDTLSVWSEEVKNINFNWELQTDFGVAFKVAKNATCFVDLDIMGTNGSLNYQNETVPFDSTVNRESENGTVDQSSSFDFDYGIRIGFQFDL